MMLLSAVCIRRYFNAADMVEGDVALINTTLSLVNLFAEALALLRVEIVANVFPWQTPAFPIICQL